MRAFKDVTLVWRNKSYVVPADQMMSLIRRIEDIVTYMDMVNHSRRGSVPQGKLASAYALALNFAGAKVTEDEVYCEMFPSNDGAIDFAASITSAITGLMQLMMPPEDSRLVRHHSGKEESPSVPRSTKPTKRR